MNRNRTLALLSAAALLTFTAWQSGVGTAASITGTPTPAVTQAVTTTSPLTSPLAGPAAAADITVQTGSANLTADTAITLNGDSLGVDGEGVTVDGSTATITAAGTYSISGTLDDGQIAVDTADEGDVMLILNGVDITNSSSAAINIVDAKDAILVLADRSTNIVADGENYVFPDAETDEPNAAVFSKADLTISGEGALYVTGNYNDGISSKDELVIESGNITVTAVDDGIRGKDSIVVEDGTITVTAGGDGLKSDNEEEGAKGSVTIDGGSISIAAGDDGIHGEGSVTVNDGDVRITQSVEGVEGGVITFNGGNTWVLSSDDGVNVSGDGDTSTMGGGFGGPPGAATAATAYTGDFRLHINGGYLVVNAQGDGLDANGAIDMTGGVVIVNGPTGSGNGALDYDAGFDISGGLLVAAGSSGMAQAPGTTSSQNSVLINFSTAQEAGTLVHIGDNEGNALLTFAPAKDFQSLVVSSPDLVTGTTYNVYTGGSSTATATDGLYTGGTYTPGDLNTSFTVSGAVTTVGNQTRGGRMGRP